MEKQKANNRNEEIAQAAGGADRIILLRPRLESALRIARRASDKERRVVEALCRISLEEVPAPLREA